MDLGLDRLPVVIEPLHQPVGMDRVAGNAVRKLLLGGHLFLDDALVIFEITVDNTKQIFKKYIGNDNPKKL